MAGGQTENYGLNQWRAEDQVLREEFNRDNRAVDGALASLASAVTAGLAQKYGMDNPILIQGDYVGTGGPSIYVPTGFCPAFVMVFAMGDAGSYDYVFMAGDSRAQLLETQFSSRQICTDALQFHEFGFSASYQPEKINGFNVAGRPYHYVAFR